jgi:hypothetical protein
MPRPGKVPQGRRPASQGILDPEEGFGGHRPLLNQVRQGGDGHGPMLPRGRSGDLGEDRLIHAGAQRVSSHTELASIHTSGRSLHGRRRPGQPVQAGLHCCGDPVHGDALRLAFLDLALQKPDRDARFLGSGHCASDPLVRGLGVPSSRQQNGEEGHPPQDRHLRLHGLGSLTWLFNGSFTSSHL